MVFDRMGLRGIAHETITWDLVFRYALAAGRHLNIERAAIGRDTRTTGELFAHAATAGLLRAGLDVDLLGIVPTPALQQYVETRAIAGLQITASHNPPEYNGVKVIGTDGSVLPFETTRSLQETVKKNRDASDNTGVGTNDTAADDSSLEATGSSRRVEDANQAYVENLLGSIKHDDIQQKTLTVVLDPGNGAGGLTSPTLCRRLGCQVHTLSAQPDGTFPGRDPEPTPEALSALQEMVTTQDADLGIAHDGDADRTIFVDDEGSYVDGNAAFATLVAAEIEPDDTVVIPVNASQRVVDVVTHHGGDIAYTRIGNVHIIDRIRTLRSEGEVVAIAGEGNGGVIYPEHRLGRDGGYTAAKFLQLLTDRRASEVLEPHRGYHFERENVAYNDEEERKRIMERAAEWAASADGETTSIDGYRVNLDDKWVLVRPSGTEPYVRIYAESPSEQQTSSLLSTIKERIA